VNLKSQNYEMALKLFKKARNIDPEYAMTFYKLGQTFEGLGKYAEANNAYKRANDLDHFMTRNPSLVNQFYDSIRRKNPKGVYVVSTDKIFEANSKNGIIDHELIPDGVHPSIKGQALMAYEVTRNLPTQKFRVRTPLQTTTGRIISGKMLGVVVILRAGLGMVGGILKLVPGAKVGHIGLFRDPRSLRPVEYFCKLYKP